MDSKINIDDLKLAAERLWAVVANVSGGDWPSQSARWQRAAEFARDAYFKAIGEEGSAVALATMLGTSGEPDDPAGAGVDDASTLFYGQMVLNQKQNAAIGARVISFLHAHNVALTGTAGDIEMALNDIVLRSKEKVIQETEKKQQRIVDEAVRKARTATGESEAVKEQLATVRLRLQLAFNFIDELRKNMAVEEDHALQDSHYFYWMKNVGSTIEHTLEVLESEIDPESNPIDVLVQLGALDKDKDAAFIEKARAYCDEPVELRSGKRIIIDPIEQDKTKADCDQHGEHPAFSGLKPQPIPDRPVSFHDMERAIVRLTNQVDYLKRHLKL